MIAIKKDGADIPAMLAKTALVSSQVPFLTAATTPNKIPMMVAKSIAAMANNKVPGNASVKTDPTFFFV